MLDVHCYKVIISSKLTFYIISYNTGCVSGQRGVSEWTQHTTRTKSSGDTEDLCEGDETPHSSPRLCSDPSLPWGCRTEAATAPMLFLHPTKHCTEYQDRRADTLPHARATLQAQITFTWTFRQLLLWAWKSQLACFTDRRGWSWVMTEQHQIMHAVIL